MPVSLFGAVIVYKIIFTNGIKSTMLSQVYCIILKTFSKFEVNIEAAY